jgi:ammonium transporter, Amt family
LFTKNRFILYTHLFLFSPSLFAADNLAYTLDSLWVIFAAILVFFMQAGFALLESGIHSEKNITNVFTKNLMDFVIASFGFFAIGFALMFGEGNAFVGSEGWFLIDQGKSFTSLDWTHIPLSLKFIFQLVFAGTAATIISGAIGGRVKFSSYLILSIAITTFIYPVLGKWVWGGGWASQLGFFDFAGSTVVHGVGGFAALAAVMVVGPRQGRFDHQGRANALPSYNITFAGLGTMILWMGWFGFNAGSTMAIVGSEKLIGHILVTTNMAAAAGAITTMAIVWLKERKYDLPMTLNGALAGLVGITAGCAFVDTMGAFLIGTVSGVLVYMSTHLIEKFKIDDVVGAFPVHGVCGLWGTAALGLFASPQWAGSAGLPGVGLFYGGGVWPFIVQFACSLAICFTSFFASYITVLGIKLLMGVRVSEHHEAMGLDLAEHSNFSFHKVSAIQGFNRESSSSSPLSPIEMQ